MDENLRKSTSPSSADAEMLTRGGKRIKVSDEEFAVMLEKAGGFRSRLAKQLGVTVSAITHRIQRSPYLREVCKTVEETVLDLAEAGLIKAAQNGEPWAITFILKCKGRKRGWIERQNLVFEGENAIPPPIVIDIHDKEFVEAERVKNDAAMAEIVDATFSDVPAIAAELAQGRAETGSGGPVSRPAEAEASVEGGSAKSPETAETAETSGATAQPLDAGTGNGARETPVEPVVRAPRTPSEAAAMRRAEGNAAQQARQQVAHTDGRFTASKNRRSVF